jgi:hypothetical protein
MIDAKKIPHDSDTKGNFARWVGLLLAPVAWSVQLEALWLTSEYGCLDGNFNWNHIVAAAALACSILGGIIAWNYIPEGAYEASKEKGTPRVRKRFIGYLGVALSIEFSILIIAMWLPTLFGVPCHK